MWFLCLCCWGFTDLLELEMNCFQNICRSLGCRQYLLHPHSGILVLWGGRLLASVALFVGSAVLCTPFSLGSTIVHLQDSSFLPVPPALCGVWTEALLHLDRSPHRATFVCPAYSPTLCGWTDSVGFSFHTLCIWLLNGTFSVMDVCVFLQILDCIYNSCF